MIHIIKLAVGAKDISQIRDWQERRARQDPPLRHRTRNFPKRTAEILDGGSIYWVVAGALLVRQRIVDIVEDRREDNSACAAFVLDPALVPVVPRLVKAFQGWRYLTTQDAPTDLDKRRMADGETDLPPELLRELRALCLL